MEESMHDTLNIPNQKYELTDNTVRVANKIYFQIRALRNFGNVHKDDLGGYVESPLCLSQRGKCWVDKLSFVDKDARVKGNAQVIKSSIEDAAIVAGDSIVEDSYVRGHAKVDNFAEVRNSNLRDNAQVIDNAIVSAVTIVRDNATISGRARVEQSYVIDNAVIKGRAYVSYSEVRGNAEVSANAKVINSLLRDNAKAYGSAKLDNYTLLYENSQVFGRASASNIVLHDNSKLYGNADVKSFSEDEQALRFYDNVEVCGNSSISITYDESKIGECYVVTGKVTLENVTASNVTELEEAIKISKEKTLENPKADEISKNKDKSKSSLRTNRKPKILKDLKDLSNEL